MAVVGTVLQEILRLKKLYRLKIELDDIATQEKTLKKLLKTARNTEIGRSYDFKSILKSDDIRKSFTEFVPTYDYDKIFDQWWHKTLEGVDDVTWPGRIKHFALSSGTSGSSSKRIPVSRQMLRSVRRVSVRQMLTMYDYKMPPEFYQKSLLMVGGSSELTRVSNHFEGDLSGILASKLPVWFQKFRKPNSKISNIKDWNEKLETLAEEAPKWDIGIVAGVPAWVKILIEKIIEKHQVESIYDIWPNFKIYVHGGVAFAPYKEKFDQLLGEDAIYLDTYLASEGFMAYQHARCEPNTLELVLDKGIYFEFIPFNDSNFTPEGNVIGSPITLSLEEVEENIDYALLISTNAGAWRYLIGDTIKFVNKQQHQICITGRTKHFLSLCGEHLSVDNMNQGIMNVSKKIGSSIEEFTVCGKPNQGSFAHHWYIACDNDSINDIEIAQLLDKELKQLNADYSVEREAALNDIFVTKLPLQVFLDWLDSQGKLGGQTKFPRVLKGEQLKDWQNFIKK